MKKKLEADLMSLAHRVLRLKGKEDINQMLLETQKLYEKLSVLRFVEDNFSDVKPTIGYTEIEDKLAVIFDPETSSDKAVTEPIKEEDPTISETKTEEAIAEVSAVEAVEEIAPAEIPEEMVKAEETEPTKPEESSLASSVTDQIERSGKAIADLIKGIRGTAPKQEIEKEAKENTVSETDSIAELDIPEENVAPVEVEAVAEAHEESASSEEATKSESEKLDTPTATTKDDFFKPAFEWSFESKTEEPKDADAKITPAQISFDDLLGESYTDPVFVKPEDLQQEKETMKPTEKSEVISISRNFNDTANVISINKSETLNDRASKGIIIGLNDRIAFMNHLFNNSSEDYNRVLSQLMTLDTMGEATNFIDTMVKPDYNNWVGKEDYEERFMEIIEKKFS